ncbi:DUF1330 domain-containing protein [Hydromonas duriensis]|uniref:Uncharacterized protein (DUF1330 family) n=1 Tax=Hydromonas duriensis TaxID=1527608 RepID=A0A4R6Y9S3_9BURK|nr:DUF1330 domain-containing protein [Hydromonas duriensis]TDR32197.1 uncharacterized protein (DUF1330 family) [Hydromonas duriensis]
MTVPAYMIFNVDVTNPEQYDQYRAFSSKAIEEHGAEPLVRGGAQTVLEGHVHPRTVILKFASVEKAQAFYDSETYKKGRELRKDAAIANIVIVEGLA